MNCTQHTFFWGFSGEISWGIFGGNFWDFFGEHVSEFSFTIFIGIWTFSDMDKLKDWIKFDWDFLRFFSDCDKVISGVNFDNWVIFANLAISESVRINFGGSGNLTIFSTLEFFSKVVSCLIFMKVYLYFILGSSSLNQV